MFETNKVVTFKSEIYIMFEGDNEAEKCKDICKEYTQKNNFTLIFTPITFIKQSKEFQGIIITINNNPLNPEEENILKKHTFTLVYKIRSEIKNVYVYGLYKDVSFFISDKNE